MSIELEIAGGHVTAAVTHDEQEISPHTGRPVRRVEAQFHTGSEATREQVVNALSSGEIRVRTPDGANFRVTRRSHSYEQGSQVTTFTVVLDEIEELACDAVVLDGSLELVPDQYQEQFKDNAIIIELTTTTFSADTEAFENLLDRDRPQYFPVVRRGVQDHALRMRFGRCLFHDNADGSRRHKVLLVQDTYDEREDQQFKGFNWPEMQRVQEAVVVLQQTVEGLLDRLVAAGTLSSDDSEAIRDGAQEVSQRQLRQFDRTADEHDL
jgi:hypothetical protein